MGSSTMLDIIGSIVIGGFLLIMGLRLNAQASEASNVYSANLILQQNITAVVSILEEDFKKIGYCKDWRKIPDPSKALRIAEASRIRFWTDVGNDGTLDSITYYVGSPIQLLSTPNPRDRFLYRQVNTTAPTSMNLGVTQFAFKFYDAENDPQDVRSRRNSWLIRRSMKCSGDSSDLSRRTYAIAEEPTWDARICC
jgi:type II secretory pathway component PulJ